MLTEYEVLWLIWKLEQLYCLGSLSKPLAGWAACRIFPNILTFSRWFSLRDSKGGFRYGEVLKLLNKTLVTLISKHPGAANLSSFQPISLCNTVY